jgi:glutaconate CoA-transferase subunit A
MRTSVRHANSSLVASASDMPRSVQLTLSEAIATQVHDGDVVALEGFTHLIPFAAGHEIIRQGRRDLTVVRMTPDVVYDQLIGMGCVARMIFSYGGNPGVGSLHRMRDAVEKGWPRQLALVEHSHAGLANAYVAGASKLPFAVLKGYAGTDLEERGQQSGAIAFVECPFTGQRLSAVRAINPDVTVIHAQQADHSGNVMLWGLAGVQKEAVLAAKTAVATVEEVVDELRPRPHSVVLPAWTIAAVCPVPGGARPSYAHGYYARDNDFYSAWDEIARNRDRFTEWMRAEVLA